MKKKFIVVLLCLFTLSCGMFALSSCKDKECTHAWGEWSVSVPATCTTQGTKQRKCNKCDAVQTENTDIAAHEYDAENLVWTWNGYESAKATLSCVMNSAHTRQINANITDEVTSAPTCTATGVKTYTATVKIDGVTYTATKNETLAALGHTEVTDGAVAATCTKTGLTEGSHCSVCNEVLVAQRETAKANHTEIKIAAVAATCSSEGATEGVKCSVCNAILVEPQSISKVSHTKVTIPAVAATCSENGLTEGEKCSVCGYIVVAQQPTEKLQHAEITLLGVVPSCSKEGLTEGKKCSVCGAITVEQKSIAKLSHTEEVVVGKEPTCSATGLSDGKKCSVCQETIVAQTILPKIACDYVSVETAPTCEAQGYTTHTCSMCKDSYVDTYVDELGHNWGAWQVSGSYTLRNCTNACECGKSQRISSIEAIYNGVRLLTGETVWKDDVDVTATLSDRTTVAITDFTLENDEMTVDGTNYVDVKFHTMSTKMSVPAIYDNLPNLTSAIEFAYTEENGVITITGFTGSSTNIVIPAHINRVPVRYIGESAFNGKETIKSVIIPDSVTDIGSSAFYNCKRMIAVTLGKGLAIIGAKAFNNCISLEEINIPANVITIDGHWNGGGAFENCTALKKVIVGDDTTDIATTTIGERAFYNCTALKEAYIGNQVKSIGTEAFYGCFSMTTVTIGSAVETIGSNAFTNCEALLAVTIPDSVTVIESEAFLNCKRIKTVSLGKGLTTIGAKAFNSCISLEEINIPTNVIAIEGHWNGGGAFENCTALKKELSVMILLILRLRQLARDHSIIVLHSKKFI